MDFSKDEALDLIMGFPNEQRSQMVSLAEKLAGMQVEERDILRQAVTWIEKYSVNKPDQKKGRGPDKAPRRKHARQIGSVTNAAEA